MLTPSLSPTPDTDGPEQHDNSIASTSQNDGEFWELPYEEPIRTAKYQSWEGFEAQKEDVQHSCYVTEAGPSVFDTVIAATEDYLHIDNSEYLVVESHAYMASLLALGLGRSSVFFAWDEKKHAFSPVLPRIRISDYSGHSLEQVVVAFLGCGKMTRALQSFVGQTYSRRTTPGRVALADSVATLLATLQGRLSSFDGIANTIVQLEAKFQPVHAILSCFQRLVINVSATKDDESMLSIIFEEIQSMEHRTDSLREILLEILSRVSQPWLEFAGEWLGIQRESGIPLSKNGQGKSFVKVDTKEWIDEQGLDMQEPDYLLDYDKIPSFILPDDARALFEVGRSLRFLRDHHSDHPLARSDVIATANPPSLEWNFSWEDVIQIEAKALQYEKDLTDAVLSFQDSTPPETLLSKGNRPSEFELDFFGRPEEDMQAHVLASIGLLNAIPTPQVRSDKLSRGLSQYLDSTSNLLANCDSIFAPPISLSPILSFNPIIAAQARVVNGTCMRLFFQSHQLRRHLAVQRSFYLLGNGIFSSRLAHALFDPELESAERHRGIARSGGTMGLRLGGRDTWPPASSELRLSLMGVLTESYVSDKPPSKSGSGSSSNQESLPGDLSFAVRDMTDEEIEKCMNPDSIEALDFLRLSYKPPSPLEAVITPVILYKYDKLFKLLLRAIRMLYVVKALHRDANDRTSCWQDIDNTAQRFRIEAHHFISSICGYFLDTGIDATWRVFERKLDQIEERISKDSDNITLGQNEGLDKLREYHERVLDRIMFALFLRKRQQPVLQLLEEIFTLILKFSKYSRENAVGMTSNMSREEMRQLYARFKKKVGVFITVCRGLSEKKGYGDKKVLDNRMSGQEGLFGGDDLAEENTVSQLLLRLEMSSYFSRSV